MLGCVSTFSEQGLGVTINVSFNYGKNDQLTGATITPSIDENARFIGPDPPSTLTTGTFLPGMTPLPQTMRVDINSAALKNLSPQQLQALGTAAAKLGNPDVRNALGGAISDEQKRRAKEQKKHCQSGQSDCSGD